MQRLRIATLLLVLGIAGMACNLYWGNPSPDPHSGPAWPDASVNPHDGGYHPDGPVYPDGGWWYPDADVIDGGSSCGGACPDAAILPPDACGH